MKRRMEQKLALARAQIDLENEKLEMEWALEKQILEIKIASKSVFQKKKEMEKKKLQDQLKQLCDSEVRVESEIQKLQNQKKEAKRLATNSKVTRVAKFEELPIGPLNSTPIVDPEEGTSTAGTKKKTVDRLQSTISIVKKKGHEAKKEETESKEECESEEGSSLDNSLVEDLGESSSCNTSDEKKRKRRDAAVSTRAQMSARQFLSRKLPVFSGRPDEWPIFISSFNTTTKACGFSNLENLARLQESLRGPAREAVCTRMLLPGSVPQIIDTLRMLYRRPEQLLNTLLVKVRKAEPPRSDRLGSFISFGMVVQQLCDHLEATELNDHLVNPLLIQELVGKLPPSTKMDWVRFKRQHSKITLRTLSDFLSDLVSTASEVTGITDAPSDPGNRLGKSKGGKQKEYESHINTHLEGSSKPEHTRRHVRYVVALIID